MGLASELSDSVLPPQLRSVAAPGASIKDVESQLGKPKGIEKQGKFTVYLYNLSGLDFDTSLGFQDEKLYFVHVIFIDPKIKFSDLKKVLTESDLNQALNLMQRQKGHERGRSFTVKKNKLGFGGRFSNSSDRTLLEATFWPPGSPPP